VAAALGAAAPDRAQARVVVRELRHTRQRRRLGDTDWYDIAYRVYLFALVGLTLVVWISDAIDGAIGDDGIETAELLATGPAIIGLGIVVAFALGLRSGADGGPVSIEVADIRHVLLAPVPRRAVMLRPIGQRLRAAAFALALGAAILGQLVATELEGSRAAWAAACGAYGAMVGTTFVAAAVIAHAVAMPRWAATALATIVVGWQGLAAWGASTDELTGAARIGPGNLAGRLALWGVDQRPIDLVSVAVVVLLGAAALVLGGRLRLEALARRGELVSQLRFAATVQDLRTVVQLRRQLRAEAMRDRPWGGRSEPGRPLPARPDTVRRVARPPEPPSPTVVWRRGVRSLRRLPLARLVRIALLAAVGGAAAAFTVSSSPLFALVLLGALFVVGLEVLEPLSQEVDRPDLTDSLPVDRCWIYAHHLVAPAGLLVAVAAIGAATAAAIEPNIAVGAVLAAVPVTFAGAAGPVVVTVLDAPSAPSPTTLLGAPRDAETTMVPPEFAGFSTAVKTLIPVVLSAAGTVPVVVAGLTDDTGAVARALLGLALYVAAVVVWVRRRDRWAGSTRNFFEQGRAAS